MCKFRQTGLKNHAYPFGKSGKSGAHDFSRWRAEADADTAPVVHCVAASAATGGTSPLTIPTLPVSGLKLNVMTWPEAAIMWITVASTDPSG